MLAWHVFRNWLLVKKPLTHLPALALSVIIPAVAMVIFLGSVDSVPDQPTAPFGLGSYDASFSGTFIPVNGPMSVLVRSYLFRFFEDPAWEAKAFVGIPTKSIPVLLDLENHSRIHV